MMENDLSNLIALECAAYETASDDERDAIAKRLATLLRVNDKQQAAIDSAERIRLEDERERIKIENDRVDASERRILESERNSIERDTAKAQLELQQLQAEKQERTNIIVAAINFVGTIGKELLGMHAERRNMHELMHFEKSDEGYNLMTTQSSKKFFLNRKR